MSYSYPPIRSQNPEKWPENVEGPYYTNTNCVDCGNCSRHCPGCFARKSFPNHWYVKKQPETPFERVQMQRAMECCKGKCIMKSEQ